MTTSRWNIKIIIIIYYNISDLCLEIIMLVKTSVLGYRLIRLTGVLTDSARREIVSVLGTSQVPVVLNYQ